MRPRGAVPTSKASTPKDVTARGDWQYEVGHPIPLPLYLCCSTELSLWRSLDYEPGRVLIHTSGMDTTPEGTDVGHLRSDLDEFVCTQDVLFVQLYEGTQYREGPWPFAPTLGFDHNCEVLREVAPQVQAVLVGNRLAETGDVQGIGDQRDGPAELASERCCQRVYEAGALIKSLGGRPAFGIVDYQGLMDCYRMPGQPLRQALADVNALVIFFLAFKCWPKMKPLYDDDRQELFVPKKLLDGPPYRLWQDWVGSLDCWGGVDYMQGLHLHNDLRLHEAGYKAGVIGQLPDGTK